MSWGQARFVAGTKWVCPRDKARFSAFLHNGSPVVRGANRVSTLPLGQSRGQRAAEKVNVLKVYVPFLLARGEIEVLGADIPTFFLSGPP